MSAELLLLIVLDPYLKVDEMFVLVPVVDLEDDHLPGGDGHSLVRVPVDHVHVLVAISGQYLLGGKLDSFVISLFWGRS